MAYRAIKPGINPNPKSNLVTIQCLKLRVPKMPKVRMQYIYIQYDFDSCDLFFIFFLNYYSEY